MRSSYVYRKTKGKLPYLSIDRRDLKYVAQELARHMQKPKKVNMALLTPAGRYLAGRKRVGTFVGITETKGSLDVYTDSDWHGCQKKTHVGLVFDMERTSSSYKVVYASRSGSIEFGGGRARGNYRRRD